jgi:hypothetical protein
MEQVVFIKWDDDALSPAIFDIGVSTNWPDTEFIIEEIKPTEVGLAEKLALKGEFEKLIKDNGFQGFEFLRDWAITKIEVKNVEISSLKQALADTQCEWEADADGIYQTACNNSLAYDYDVRTTLDSFPHCPACGRKISIIGIDGA